MRIYHKISATERFAKKWIPEPNSGCWLWEGAHVPFGYGIMGRGGRGAGNHYAHRLSYEIYVGPVPDGMKVLHSCDNPPCVNPDHLFLGTQKNNMEDKVAKGRHRPGEEHPNAVLTWEMVRAMRTEYATGTTSLSILGRKFGICFQHVHNVVRHQIWKE